MSATLKTIVANSLFLCVLTAQGQTIYFDKNYDYNLKTEAYYNSSFELEQGGYLFIHTSLSPSSKCVRLVETDEHGDTIWTKPYCSSGGSYASANAIITSDNNIAFFTTRTFGSSITDVAYYNFWKIAPNGDTLFTKIYGDTSMNNIATWVIETFDKGFVFVGQMSDISSMDGDIYLVKTDSMGNFEVDDTQEADIREWADAEMPGLTGSSAKSILNLVFGEVIYPIVPDWEGSGKTDETGNEGSQPTITTAKNEKCRLAIWPNPFTDITSVSYHLPENFNSAELQIWSVTGQLVKTYVLQNSENIIQLSSGKNFTAGMYNIVLIVNGKRECFEKVVILKE